MSFIDHLAAALNIQLQVKQKGKSHNVTWTGFACVMFSGSKHGPTINRLQTCPCSINTVFFFSFHPLTGSHPDMADPVEPTLLDFGTRSSIGKSNTFK